MTGNSLGGQNFMGGLVNFPVFFDWTGLPVHEADERLSSRNAREVHRAQRAAGKRMRKNAGDEDRIAASLILKNWLLHQTERDD